MKHNHTILVGSTYIDNLHVLTTASNYVHVSRFHIGYFTGRGKVLKLKRSTRPRGSGGMPPPEHLLTITALVAFQSLVFLQLHCTVLNTKRVEYAVFQSLDIFSVMVHAIETQDIPT